MKVASLFDCQDVHYVLLTGCHLVVVAVCIHTLSDLLSDQDLMQCAVCVCVFCADIVLSRPVTVQVTATCY